MFGVASTTAVLTSSYSGVGIMLAFAISLIVPSLIALLGLGFGIRKLRQHITGAGFHQYQVGSEDEYPKAQRDRMISAMADYIDADEFRGRKSFRGSMHDGYE